MKNYLKSMWDAKYIILITLLMFFSLGYSLGDGLITSIIKCILVTLLLFTAAFFTKKYQQ